MHPLRGEFYYRTICPYCSRFEHYVLDPLERLRYLSVKRINADLEYSTRSLARCKLFADRFFGVPRVITPLLIIYQGKNEDVRAVYFGIFAEAGEEEGPVEEEVAKMARDVIDYICQRLRIPKEYLLQDPLIEKAVRGI